MERASQSAEHSGTGAVGGHQFLSGADHAQRALDQIGSPRPRQLDARGHRDCARGAGGHAGGAEDALARIDRWYRWGPAGDRRPTGGVFEGGRSVRQGDRFIEQPATESDHALERASRRVAAENELDRVRRADLDAGRVPVAAGRIDRRQAAGGGLEQWLGFRVAGRGDAVSQRSEQAADEVKRHVSDPCRRNRAQSSC